MDMHRHLMKFVLTLVKKEAKILTTDLRREQKETFIVAVRVAKFDELAK